ncbi:hypothetical protein JW711_00480 [Candidatus Woesearchaeota archaeon]|nr:hypothetical protein [Candidatus Woesearchaeota archaeon]
MKLVYIPEIIRMLSRRIRVCFFGVRRYAGSSSQVGKKIIHDCYDEKKGYFRVSAGHFCEFYCRDFGWCAESLVNLRYKDKVVSTLRYALTVFEAHGRVEQTISPAGIAFTFPGRYSPDSLAFLVHAVRASGDRNLVKRFKPFLEREVARYFKEVIDSRTGLVKRGVQFSSMKDYSVRSSSCYDNCMTAMLKEDLDFLGLANPFRRYDYHSLIIRNFWNGSFFVDDLSKAKDDPLNAVTGDSNVFPLWAGVVKEGKVLRGALRAVMKEGLDVPLPLKYTAGHRKGQRMIRWEFFAGDYERDAVWAHMGLLYIDLLSRINKPLARKRLAEYRKRILQHKNFLEVYDRNGKPFRTPLYYSDESMLWVANYLVLEKDLL